MTTPKTGIDAFDPRIYLQEYYTVDPEAEDMFVVNFMIQTLRKLPPDLFILEFGGGPTLFAVAALAPYAREIHFCDYIPASLTEVQKWLDDEPDAFNWEAYIKLALELDDQPTTPTAINHRAADMRRKVTRLSKCDGLAKSPLGQNHNQYDLVVAQSCTEVAASTVAEWQQIIRNITTLVKPGGWLLISLITGTTAYRIGHSHFSCVSLTKEDVQQGYREAGYDPATFQLEELIIPSRHEYGGVISAVARKP